MSQKQQKIVIHISGRDQPGVTARLTSEIFKNNARLINIGQSLLNGYLSLSALVEFPSGSNALQDLLVYVSQKGLKLEMHPFAAPKKRDSKTLALCATFIGDLGGTDSVSKVTGYLADIEANIRDIKTLSDDYMSGMELVFEITPDANNLHEPKKIQEDLFKIATKERVDFAIQKETIFRRNRRLVCFDVDSTFVSAEAIDELADLVGCKDKVSKITAKAMKGEISFKEALFERVMLLKGLKLSEAKKCLESHKPAESTIKVLKILKKLGYKVGLVSGGFDFYVNHLKEKYELDFAFANSLELDDQNCFTGKVIGNVVDADRKADLLKQMALENNCTLDQCIAMGDGANDVEMLKLAGLAIAYQAKNKLKEVADVHLDKTSFESIFYLLGYKRSELLSFEKLL